MLNNFFSKLKDSLTKTKENFTDKLNSILGLAITIDDDLYEEIEEMLILGDIGIDVSCDIIEKLKTIVRERKIKDPNMIKPVIKEIILDMLNESVDITQEKFPKIIIMIGINGVGKTTSIGKMANYFKNNNKDVVIAAGDTFRAAAIDQLQVWADRVDVKMIRHNQGSDPSAVIFDAIKSFKSKNSDVLICDSAGRLHNKKNLMNELRKMNRIIENECNDVDREIYLVLDATTGQNALNQAIEFKEVANITGIILTKLDGTAKGGMIISIKNKLAIPVKYIGTGEGIDDIQPFNAEEFVDALI
ncbi:signal recognition particle-docking protein FtsY [Candidatus Arthromitus sp. SFB-mouse-Japan]|uniref:signal recognition particle-docking protein FtsY n=1 Tax=Candidatus Arthromitus sp. SFB-mouse TaxID=49118 RepID=UPI00021B8064|nr:signal recognition particle-docking protein FtsY [Candidatus Arthromitus sp. SFB-mouse]EIA21903.1 signal recognition particle-docking protein FtsY [Candidatus Arthromitus sp. SFB-2]EIA23394.1 signal recognition particle-docking protein FtsY [Candidatus Arthromitus sp. SFB-1]EIA26398.1 signal recognition particle-docking protein FtsY [Candidatus Arthromitus sp. SFB-4]EIA26781.1 signal recognition particle-docking protein FtsY [Candidatus Arthromitus sp. SFB-3]EIA28619.1 signal recognition pa